MTKFLRFLLAKGYITDTEHLPMYSEVMNQEQPIADVILWQARIALASSLIGNVC